MFEWGGGQTLLNSKYSRKGFTLIELLAVIIILGILMIIAIPSVTEYILNSRKSAYITTASNYIASVRNKVNSLEYKFTDLNTIYYVPSKCIKLEKGGKSPFGDWKEAYVAVTFDGKGYQYYWTSYDSAGYGVTLTKENELESSQVVSGMTSINKGTSNGVRMISEVGTDCTAIVTKEISEAYATNASCFAFTPGTKTITRYYENEGNNSSNPPCPKDVVIPNQIGGVDVEVLATGTSTTGVFVDRNITNVVLPSTLKTIGNYAIYQNKLTGTLTIPKSVTSLGSYAFCGTQDGSTNKLTTVVFEGGAQLQTISNNALQYNALTGTLIIPNTVTSIGAQAFSGTTGSVGIKTNQLTALIFENNSVITTIGTSAFRDNNIGGSLIIPKTVITIGDRTFNTNAYASVTFENPSQLQQIGMEAFYGSRHTFTSITIPSNVTLIGSKAFYNRVLTKIINTTGRPFTWCDAASGIVETANCSPTTTVTTGNLTITGSYARTVNITAN